MRRIGNYKPINDGQWAVPGRRANDLYAIWKSTYESIPPEKRDVYGAWQAAFNTLVRRQRMRAQSFRPLDVANSTHTPEIDWQRYILVHFAGDAARLARMQALSTQGAAGDAPCAPISTNVSQPA